MMFCLKSAGSTIVLNPRARNGYFVNFERDNGEVIIDQKNGGQASYQISVLRRGWKIQRGSKWTKAMICFVNTKKVPPSGVIGLKQGDVVSFRFSKTSPVQFKYVLYKTEPLDTRQDVTKGVNPIPQTPNPETVKSEPSTPQSSSTTVIPQTRVQNEITNASQTPKTSEIRNQTPNASQVSSNELEPMETETETHSLASTIRKLQNSITTLEPKVTPTPSKDSNIDDEINEIKKQVQLKHETLNNTRDSIDLENCLTEAKNSRRLSLEDKATLMKQIELLMDNEIRLKTDIKSLEESLVKEKEMYVRISRQMKDMENRNIRLEKMFNVETNRIRGDLEPDLTCKMCTKPFTEAVVINCGHSYCKDCVKSWRRKNKVCPTCETLIVSHVKVVALDKVVKRWLYATGE